MLAPYMRMPSKQPQQLTKDEESIINSFYEERKARSNNHKYHNLLKKNISFFQPEKTQEDSIAISPVYAAPKNNDTVKLQERRMSQPPLPPTAPKASANAQIPQKKSRAKSEYLRQISIPNEDAVQVSQALSTKNADEKYKEHLKNQLNKRININQYLRNWEEDKENWQKSDYNEMNSNCIEKNDKRRTQSQFGSRYVRLAGKDKYQENQHSLLSQPNIDQYSRISHNVSRHSLQQTAENIPFHQKSLDDLRERIPSEVNIQKGSQPYRSSNIKHTFGSAHSSRRLSQASQESPEASFPERELQVKDYANCLTNEQLSQLHQNSHPLRQERPSRPKPLPSSYTLKYNYIDPEQQSHYKRRIQDLQLELQQLKNRHKKEDKFIQSIIKMRKVMLGCEDDCSLKELWRWIKQLPKK